MSTGTTGKRKGPALELVEIKMSPQPQESMSSTYINTSQWVVGSNEGCSMRLKAA